MPYTNRAAHINVSLRIDQNIHAMKPAAALATTEKKSFSMTDTNKAESDIIANIPAKIVINTEPAIPTTFRKVLLTIFSIYNVISYYSSSALMGLNIVASHGLNHDSHPALRAYTVAYLNRHDSSWSVESVTLDFGLRHLHGFASYAVGKLGTASLLFLGPFFI